MKTATVIVFFVILMCIVEHICGSVEEFFKGIENTFGPAWQSFKRAIKRPVKIKRMGRGRRRKKTTTTTTTTTTSTTEIPELETRPAYYKRVALPFISSPDWRGVENWSLLQIPQYVFRKGQYCKCKKRHFEERPANHNSSRLTHLLKHRLTDSSHTVDNKDLAIQ